MINLKVSNISTSTPDAAKEFVKTEKSPPSEIASVASATEAKLTEIIFVARRIAVLAEEVMRENMNSHPPVAGSSILHHSPDLALRLLTATEEQLSSISATSGHDLK